MTTLLIKRTNALTGVETKTEVVFNQTLATETIDQLHWLLSTNHPDDQVDFTWGANFICGQPMNMRFEGAMVDSGAMTYKDYFEKWYTKAKA